MAPPVIFIFGLGYVGRRFGHMMAASGWSVRGTTRQPDNFAAERAAGWNIIPFSDQQKMPDPARSLDGVSAILSTIAPISGQDPVLRLHADDLAGFAGWLARLLLVNPVNGFRVSSVCQTLEFGEAISAVEMLEIIHECKAISRPLLIKCHVNVHTTIPAVPKRLTGGVKLSLLLWDLFSDQAVPCCMVSREARQRTIENRTQVTRTVKVLRTERSQFSDSLLSGFLTEASIVRRLDQFGPTSITFLCGFCRLLLRQFNLPNILGGGPTSSILVPV